MQPLQLAAGLLRLRRVDLGDRRAHVVVDRDQPGEDVLDVLQPRGGGEGLLVGLRARDEARALPLAEVLAHRRRHRHERLQGVGALGLPAARGLVERLRLGREVAREGEHRVRVGHGLAEGGLAVAVEVGFHPARLEVGVGAEQRRLGQEEEVAGLLEHLAARELDVERHGVLRVGAVGARVDDHVELRQLGHARDDALHLLVARVGLAPGLLHVLHGRAHVGAALVEQRGVVEVRAFGELAVGGALVRQLLGRVGQRGRVVEQVGLDRGEVLALRGGRLRGGRLVGLAGAAAGGESGRDQRGSEQERTH